MLQRALLPKPSFHCKRRNQFIDLPVEIVGEIIGFLDMASFLNIASTCKALKQLADPEKPEGRRLWNLVRRRLGWPDPSITSVAMTDFQFLKRQYGKGCDRCSNTPRLRTLRWEFRGLRLCKRCLGTHTLRDYTMPYWMQDRCSSLPSILVQTIPIMYTLPPYRLYLKSSVYVILNQTDDELEQSRRASRELLDFSDKVKKNARVLYETRKLEITSLADVRKSEVDAVMRLFFPTLHSTEYTRFVAYKNATARRTPFTKRSRDLLVKSLIKAKSMTGWIGSVSDQ